MSVKTPSLLERQKDASDRPERRRKLFGFIDVRFVPGHVNSRQRERVWPTVT